MAKLYDLRTLQLESNPRGKRPSSQILREHGKISNRCARVVLYGNYGNNRNYEAPSLRLTGFLRPCRPRRHIRLPNDPRRLGGSQGRWQPLSDGKGSLVSDQSGNPNHNYCDFIQNQFELDHGQLCHERNSRSGSPLHPERHAWDRRHPRREQLGLGYHDSFDDESFIGNQDRHDDSDLRVGIRTLLA